MLAGHVESSAWIAWFCNINSDGTKFEAIGGFANIEVSRCIGNYYSKILDAAIAIFIIDAASRMIEGGCCYLASAIIHPEEESCVVI